MYQSSEWTPGGGLEGKVDSEHHYVLNRDNIPNVSEQPVKSLGRLYTENLREGKKSVRI